MTEALVMQFLTRFRGSLNAAAYAAMIDAGRSSLLDELNAFSTVEPAPAPAPAKKRGRKKKAAAAAPEGPKVDATEEQVLTHLRVLGDALTVGQIAKALGAELNLAISSESVSKIIKGMLKRGQITQSGQRRGAKYTFDGSPPADSLDYAGAATRKAEDEDGEPTGG